MVLPIEDVSLPPLLKKSTLEQDSVAQPVEHLTFNQVVLGSNPSRITKPWCNALGLFCFWRFKQWLSLTLDQVFMGTPDTQSGQPNHKALVQMRCGFFVST